MAMMVAMVKKIVYHTPRDYTKIKLNSETAKSCWQLIQPPIFCFVCVDLPPAQ